MLALGAVGMLVGAISFVVMLVLFLINKMRSRSGKVKLKQARYFGILTIACVVVMIVSMVSTSSQDEKAEEEALQAEIATEESIEESEAKAESESEAKVEEEVKETFNMLPIIITGAKQLGGEYQIDAKKDGTFTIDGQTSKGYEITIAQGDDLGEYPKPEKIKLDGDNKFTYTGKVDSDTMYTDFQIDATGDKPKRIILSVYNEGALAESEEISESEPAESDIEESSEEKADEKPSNKKLFESVVATLYVYYPEVADLIDSYDVDKEIESNIIYRVYVTQEVKYYSDNDKQFVADTIGDTFYTAATKSYNKDEGTPNIKMYYSNDQSKFAENRRIMNPQEFEVKK